METIVANIAALRLNRPDLMIHQKEDEQLLLENIKQDQYYQTHQLTKEYIANHIPQDTKHMRMTEIDNLTLSTEIQDLDLNIKYEIIEFIPTFSKWKKLHTVDSQMERYGINKIKNRVCAHREDPPITTIHKMRLISKHFNQRMMLKLLKMSEFMIESTTQPSIHYYMTLFREQRKFVENGYKLQDDALLLYQDRSLLSSKPSLFSFMSASSCVSLNSSSSSSNSSRTPTFDYFARPNIIPSVVFKDVPSDFIGNNTTVKKLIVCNLKQGAFISHLKGLKQLILVRSELFNEFSNDSVEEMVSFTPIKLFSQQRDFSTTPTLRKITQFTTHENAPNNQQIRNNNTITVENTMDFKGFIERELVSKFGVSVLEPFLNTDVIHGNESTSVFNLLIESEFDNKRELIDYIFVEKLVPVEILKLLVRLKSPYWGYLIYLANTYQNGRLYAPFSMIDNTSILYGWNVQNQADELTFMAIDPHLSVNVIWKWETSLLEKLKSIISIESISHHSLITFLLFTQPQQLIEKLAQVTKRGNVSIPLLVNVIQSLHSKTEVLLFSTLCQFPETIKQHFKKNERNDNILHILASAGGGSILLNELQLFPLFKALPEMVMEVNIDGNTPYDLYIAKSDEVVKRLLRDTFPQLSSQEKSFNCEIEI